MQMQSMRLLVVALREWWMMGSHLLEMRISVTKEVQLMMTFEVTRTYAGRWGFRSSSKWQITQGTVSTQRAAIFLESLSNQGIGNTEEILNHIHSHECYCVGNICVLSSAPFPSSQRPSPFSPAYSPLSGPDFFLTAPLTTPPPFSEGEKGGSFASHTHVPL